MSRKETADKRKGSFERPCELSGRLEAFRPLYYWLEYWGDWVSSGTVGRMTILEVMRKLHEEGFASRSTADDGFPHEIRMLERALARVRLANRFQYSVLVQVHVAKATFREIASGYAIRRRGLERTLWYAYTSTQVNLIAADPILLDRPAPVYRKT